MRPPDRGGFAPTMMKSVRVLSITTAALSLLLALYACRSKQPVSASAPGSVPAAAGPAPHAIVVAANPLAAQAGMRVLQAGGSAADAAVAMQAVLGLVEPQR